jgi:hypothetical protein
MRSIKRRIEALEQHVGVKEKVLLTTQELQEGGFQCLFGDNTICRDEAEVDRTIAYYLKKAGQELDAHFIVRCFSDQYGNPKPWLQERWRKELQEKLQE